VDSEFDKELISYIFSKEGLLGQALEEYEERSGQIAMATQIWEAYFQEKIALIEAGTGIGKSLAYLAIAMLWASKRQERTVISTYTIALQHQLIEKDIPFLRKALELDLEAVLVKGMQNYLCLRKLEEAEESLDLFANEVSRREFDRLQVWSQEASSGCRSSLPFHVSSQSWEQFAAHPDECSSANCPHFRSCFFFKARRKAEDAQIIVVNHHLLLNDLQMKADEHRSGDKTILPSYERLVIDEAHHLEEVGFTVFSKQMNWIGLIKLINRFFAYRNDPEGRIRILEKFFEKTNRKASLFTIDLPAQKQEILRKLEKAFIGLKTFFEKRASPLEKRLRFQNDWQKEEEWIESIALRFREVADLIMKWVVNWQTLCGQDCPEEDAIEEINLLAVRLEEQATFLTRFFDPDADWSGHVRWIEWEEDKNVHLIAVLLDMAKRIKSIVFSPLRTAALCSATLCQGQDFSFVKRQLGLEEEEDISEAAWISPFDYEGRTRFAVPNDLPEPTLKEFTYRAIDAIARLLQASQGGALVLFTSIEMLREAHAHLITKRETKDFVFLRQGELGRAALIDRFTNASNAVLLGVDSFWEGVDIPNGALRLVIIVKLPFHALQDPLIEALQEQITANGGSAFYDYSIPRAVMKFKQGFGRLMRRKEDRGVIVCLDKRLFTKGYGKRFLKTLPNSPRLFAPLEEIEAVIAKEQHQV
jgi:ATP-dependent DNA helicase DinG